MRQFDETTDESLGTPVATACTCWRITRTDGIEIGFTDHDRSLNFSGTAFLPTNGLDGAALEATSDLAPDNADIVGILSTNGVGEADLAAGRYDGATVEVWQVDWTNTDARFLTRYGLLGEVERSGGGFQAAFRSQKDLLAVPAGRVYGRTCDARLGDARCGVDLAQADFRLSGIVSGGGDRSINVSGISAPEDAWFIHGVLRIDSGSLSGVTRSIRDHAQVNSIQTIELWDRLPELLVAGTAVTLTVGCDRKVATCSARFSNVANFRGFPTIPGPDAQFKVPSPANGEGS